MVWYEILNASLITFCIVGCFIYLRKEKTLKKVNDLPKLLDINMFKAIKVMINGIMLIQFYYALALQAWIKHRQLTETIDASDFLYVIAELAKNVFFILIVFYSVVWLNEKIRLMRGFCKDGKTGD